MSTSKEFSELGEGEAVQNRFFFQAGASCLFNTIAHGLEFSCTVGVRGNCDLHACDIGQTRIVRGEVQLEKATVLLCMNDDAVDITLWFLVSFCLWHFMGRA